MPKGSDAKQKGGESDADFLKQVQLMFPAVSEDWVISEIKRGIPHNTILDFISSPTSSHMVPKKEKTQRIPIDRGVDSPEALYELADEGQKTQNTRRIQHFFYASAKERVAELSDKAGVLDDYKKVVVDCLANAFRNLSLVGIRQVATSCGLFYAPSWKTLFEAKSRDRMVQKKDGQYLEVQLPTGKTLDVKVLKMGRARRLLLKIPEELKEEIRLTEEYSRGKEKGLIGFLEEGGLFECSVCYDEVEASEQICCGNQHVFCRQCVSCHAKEAVYGQGMSAQLSCLEQDCQSGFSRGVLKRVLDRDTYKRLDQRLAEENVLKAQIQNFQRCKYCNNGVIFEAPVEVNKVFQCDNCLAETCRLCGRDWDENHMGVPCDSFEENAEERVRKNLEEKLTLTVIRKCHVCGLAFEKDTGCNKMRCRCGATQCYLCRKPDIDYDHFCRHPKNPGDAGCRWCNKCVVFGDVEKRDQQALERVVEEAKQIGIKEEFLTLVRPKEKKRERGVAQQPNEAGERAEPRFPLLPPLPHQFARARAARPGYVGYELRGPMRALRPPNQGQMGAGGDPGQRPRGQNPSPPNDHALCGKRKC